LPVAAAMRIPLVAQGPKSGEAPASHASGDRNDRAVRHPNSSSNPLVCCETANNEKIPTNHLLVMGYYPLRFGLSLV
jgi:hypothetical protein